MNLVLILSFAALVITITSSATPPTNVSLKHQNSSVQSVGRSYGIFRVLLGYIQTGLSMLLGRDEKSSRGSSRKTGRNKVSYKQYSVLRIIPKNQEEVDDLEAIRDDFEDIQFWTKPSKKIATDVMIPPKIIDEVRQNFRERGITYDVMINDVQKLIAYENPRMTKEQKEVLLARKGHPMTWSRYHRYGDMLRYAEFLVYTYPHLVEIITIGYSSNGQPLKVLKVGTDSRGELDPGEVKPAVWIDGGMHGREWITPAVVLYILRQLVENYEKNKRLVDNADWYLLPVVNPDGYEYSHTTDRLWSKTRSNHDNSASDFTTSLLYGPCEGVNLDFNFDYHWGEAGSSDDPCSEFYAGPRPYSEPETKAVADFILDKRDQIQLYISFHSYSQKWLVPYSFSKKNSEDYEEMMNMAQKAVDAMGRISDVQYVVAASPLKRAPSSGSSDDWAKGAAGIKYSYKVELRDQGTYGYLLPATQILPTARETYLAVRALAKSIVCKS